MPRLARTSVNERNAWVIEIFTKDPTVSAPAMNKLILIKFGNTMRVKQIYALRDEVLKRLNWTKDQFGKPVPPVGPESTSL